MRFICLLPVRDEGDIIDQCLQRLLEWADKVFIFDTGSVDNTWDVVQEMAARESRLVLMGREPVFLSDARLRSYMFHVAREDFRDGDWFLRVDADEFHHISPPVFVKNFMRKHETLAYHQYYDFHLSASEVLAWDQGLETVAARSLPIEQRRRHYTVSDYSEPRLCRYRSSMKWPSTIAFPFNSGYVAEERIPIRHYPHRDPVQMKRRCLLRSVMMADKENRSYWTHADTHHWIETDWRNFIVADDLPSMEYWKPGTDLPLVHRRNHLRPFHIRATQRIVHALCLPLLDKVRTGFNTSDRPQPIPQDIVRQLEHDLRTDV